MAPDYILCDEKIKDRLIQALIREIQRQYGLKPLENAHYGKIINEKHFHRLCSLMDEEKCVYGGQTDCQTLQIEPTVFDSITWKDAIMQEEIFGPLLPILTYHDINEAIHTIERTSASFGPVHFLAKQDKYRKDQTALSDLAEAASMIRLFI